MSSTDGMGPSDPRFDPAHDPGFQRIETRNARIYALLMSSAGMAILVFTLVGQNVWESGAATVSLMNAAMMQFLAWRTLRKPARALANAQWAVFVFGTYLAVEMVVRLRFARGVEQVAVITQDGRAIVVLVVVAALVCTRRQLFAIALGLPAVSALLVALFGHVVIDLAQPLGRQLSSALINLALALLMSLGLTTAIISMRERQSRIGDEVRRMGAVASTDAMTGLMNRRGITVEIEKLLAELARDPHAMPAWLSLVDLDLLKRVNDQQGHAAGDTVLKRTAQEIVQSARRGERSGRWGGEEVLLINRAERVEDIRDRIEHLRARMHAVTWPGSVNQTASFGITQLRAGDSIESALARADRALYRAKEAGRDRVEFEKG